MWRDCCEDGSGYGVSPYDYDTADDYEDALLEAKQIVSIQEDQSHKSEDMIDQARLHRGNQYRWRLHCEDGSKYGISPDDYETADDYEEALEKAKALQETSE